jgi:hypothetical protein
VLAAYADNGCCVHTIAEFLRPRALAKVGSAAKVTSPLVETWGSVRSQIVARLRLGLTTGPSRNPHHITHMTFPRLNASLLPSWHPQPPIGWLVGWLAGWLVGPAPFRQNAQLVRLDTAANTVDTASVQRKLKDTGTGEADPPRSPPGASFKRIRRRDRHRQPAKPQAWRMREHEPWNRGSCGSCHLCFARLPLGAGITRRRRRTTAEGHF